MAGTGLFVAVMIIGRSPQHQGPPPALPAPQASEPPVPSRESGETRAAQPEPSPAQTIRAIGPPPVPSRESGEIRAPQPGPSPAQKSTAAATRETVPPVFQPRKRLATVRPGDTKERVFELFGTAFERRNGLLMRIEGMRLLASGRSSHHAEVEIAEVKIADTALGSLYWFLFGDGRLVAWGRPEEWPAAAARYQVDIDYQPDPSRTGPRRVERAARW
jgi:hypothetical protein